MLFRSTTPRRIGSSVLVRKTAAVFRQILFQVYTDRRFILSLDHRQYLHPVTRLSPSDPLDLLLFFQLYPVNLEVFSIRIILLCESCPVTLSVLHRKG